MKGYGVGVLFFSVLLCSSGLYAQQTMPNPIFEFHSGFWMNLHHFLYEQAQTASGDPLKPATPKVNGGPAWDAAVLFYKEKMISRDLLFDDGMSDIKFELEDQETAQTLMPNGKLTPELIAILEKAAPAYRQNWWKAHDNANHQWIEQVSVLVNKYGETLVRELSAAYKSSWPTYMIRVDVTNYANWAGAYTTIDPTHITISAGDRANYETAALEIVFHESSHGLVQNLRVAIAAECTKQRVKLPRLDLWHAVLFYTTGEIVRRHFPDYTPVGYKGLWERAWPMYIKALERDWKPYIEGMASFDSAVTALVREVGLSVN